MSRSRRGRGRQRRGSRRRVAHGVSVPTPVRAVAIPDSEGTLADGVVVEADVSARLLGLRLLRVRADVVLVPARVDERSVVAAPVATSRPPVSDRAPRVEGPRTAALAEATRLVTESGRTLDRLRERAAHNGH